MSSYASWSYPSWANPHLDPPVIERQRERLPAEVFRQEYGGEFVGPGIPLCKRCGFPRETCGPRAVVRDYGEPRRCSTCGHIVDENGRSLAYRTPDGRIKTRILHLISGKSRNVPRS